MPTYNVYYVADKVPHLRVIETEARLSHRTNSEEGWAEDPELEVLIQDIKKDRHYHKVAVGSVVEI